MIGRKIFSLIDNPSHHNCRLVCKTWCDFLDYEFFDWPQILLKSQPKPTSQLPPEWIALVNKIVNEGSLFEIKRLVPIIKNYHPENNPLQQACLTGDLLTIRFLIPHFDIEHIKDDKG